MKTKIISVAIQKGGSAKTTTSISLASYLSQKGFKVLAIDLDFQCNLTSVLYDGDYLQLNQNKTIYQILDDNFVSDGNILDIIHKSKLPNLHLIPAHQELSTAETQLAGKMAPEQRLTRLLERTEDYFDYVIIDCPPSLGKLPTNAFIASDFVLIPVTPNAFDVDGLIKLSDTIYRISKFNKKEIKIAGVLVTRYDPNTIANKTVYESLKEKFGDVIFNTRIPRNTDIEKANILRSDIFSVAPNSAGAMAYRAFFEKEFLPRITNEQS